MINIYTIETIILLHNMNVLKLFNEHYPVYIVPTSYSILSTYFSKEYQKVYGSVGTRSIMSIREYINKELDIDINCLKMVDLPYISKDEVEKKARNMYSHKKWSHEIVYIEHFMANKDNDYRLIIDTKSGLSSETSNTEYILYHHAISIFGVLKEMSEQAERMGANAVIAIDLDYESVGDTGSMLMVTASGTAVRYE